MAATLSTTTNKLKGARSITLDTDTDISAANTALTLTPATGHFRRLLMVTVKFSADVTKNVTITRNSGAGAGWDTLLKTISVTAAADGVWIPPGEVLIGEDDQLDVTAEAAGVGETSSLTIDSERF